jgi:hypothetical protein
LIRRPEDDGQCSECKTEWTKVYEVAREGTSKKSACAAAQTSVCSASHDFTLVGEFDSHSDLQAQRVRRPLSTNCARWRFTRLPRGRLFGSLPEVCCALQLYLRSSNPDGLCGVAALSRRRDETSRSGGESASTATDQAGGAGAHVARVEVRSRNSLSATRRASALL